MIGSKILEIRLNDDDWTRGPDNKISLTTTGASRLANGLRGIELPEGMTVEIEYDPRYLTDALIVRAPVSEADINDIIRKAYMSAMAAVHVGGAVGIHIGKGLWDHLTSKVDPDRGSAPGDRLFGFNLFLEPAWEPYSVEVRTTQVIA